MMPSCAKDWSIDSRNRAATHDALQATWRKLVAFPLEAPRRQRRRWQGVLGAEVGSRPERDMGKASSPCAFIACASSPVTGGARLHANVDHVRPRAEQKNSQEEIIPRRVEEIHDGGRIDQRKNVATISRSYSAHGRFGCASCPYDETPKRASQVSQYRSEGFAAGVRYLRRQRRSLAYCVRRRSYLITPSSFV
jgi:hypothetical protein